MLKIPLDFNTILNRRASRKLNRAAMKLLEDILARFLAF